MKKSVMLFSMLLMSYSGQFVCSAGELIFVSPHFPPASIHSAKGEVTGIDADVIREIAEKMGLTFKIEKCPWKRCLTMLEKGEADMTGTVTRTPDRERYLYFIEPSYMQRWSRVFYVPKGKSNLIQKYEDLYRLERIGIERGAKFSEKFDKDMRLKKYTITTLIQGLKMLELGRIDTVAGNEMAIDYLMMQVGIAGKFDKAQYKYIPKEDEDGVYLVLSKKSVHSDKLSEISKIVDQMKKTGRIDTYIKKYTTPNH